MTRRIVPALALFLVLYPAPSHAADDNSSALVVLTKAEQGSLPITITAYGQVQPRDTAQHTIAAPLAARVANVTVRAGEQIAAGTPMMTMEPSPETRASYAQAQLSLHLANQLVERDQSLVKAHLLTEVELAKAQKDAADAKSTLAVLEEEGASGPNLLRAPFEAIVLKVDSGPGSMVNQGAPVVELVRPDGLVLEVGVIAPQAASIAPGNPAEIKPLGGGEAIEGKVASREVVIDASTGLVPVQISFAEGKMLLGEMAQAVITTGEAHGFVVPHEAVLVNETGATYIVQAVDMVAKRVPVRVLATTQDKDVIDGKLDPAASVVLAGNHQLDDGTKLRVADASAKGAGMDEKPAK